ncbi:MAG: FHA domain-containing protein [Lachnospiraceae bacterium]|nr:FHA domain-containing protein [Lachnospiraceae bacterium]
MEKNISIIEQNDGRQLVYVTDHKNKNDVAINFANNNVIPHLAEMQLEEENGLRAIYTITDYTPMMKSVSKFPGRDEVFGLIRKVIYALEELRESFICESDVLLNKDYIYIDQQSDLIKFVLVPDVQEEKRTIKELIEDILITTTWKRTEYKSYLNVLASAISIPGVTYGDIIDVINKELENPVQYHEVDTLQQEEETKQDKETHISEETKQVEETHISEGIKQVEETFVSKEEVKTEEKPASEDEKQSIQEQIVEPVQPQVPEVSAQPQKPEEPVQSQKPEAPAQPQIPEAPQPPLNNPVQQQSMNYYVGNRVQVPEHDIDSDFGETTVLSDQFGETTVLGGSNMPMICPVLIRIKTGERVVINKTEFYIGKDPSRVDYCIFNNSAISRVHIRIVCKNGEFFVIDNNSTNHVYVNGRRIEPDVEVRLDYDTRVRLGDEDFEFKAQ